MPHLETQMKKLLFLFLFPTFLLAQTPDFKNKTRAWQAQQNAEFANPKESPLTKRALRKFDSLPFFPPDENFRIVAQFIRADSAQPFQMKTTTSRLPLYGKYGDAQFEINGQEFVLPIYQSYRLKAMEEFKDHLFLPFTDLTNGVETYGGGRFMDVSIPLGDTIVLDFNRCYNPYCAYNSRYSCPIPPAENHIDFRIAAGTKYASETH